MRSTIIALCLVAVALSQTLNFPTTYTANIIEFGRIQSYGVQSENQGAVFFNGTTIAGGQATRFSDLSFFGNSTAYYTSGATCVARNTNDRPIAYFNTVAKPNGKKCFESQNEGAVFEYKDNISTWTICASRDGKTPLYFVERPANPLKGTTRTTFKNVVASVKDNKVFNLPNRCYNSKP